MDESSYWVGPVSQPDRYRLTHLLGSGGEGEVWRAVRDGDDQREVAVKIDAVPSTPDDGWERRLSALTALDVRGLVRVEEAFVGPARHRADDTAGEDATHRYVVMNHVEGLTLRTWLDEHPDASPRRRIQILRGVAATLSALHHGPDEQEPITHGDVKPTNIIIGTDERPVLVDLGLLRPVGSGPASGRTAAYSSPELRNPDATPSPRADTFSFAVTAMETLTSLTPPLAADGGLDLPATRARISRARALRFRPIVRRQLLRSLTVEPARRPGTPVRVFAGRTAVLTLVPLLVIVGAGGSAIAVRSAEDGRTPALTSARPATTAASPTDPNSSSPTTIVDPPRTGGTATPRPHPSSSPSPTATATPTAVTTQADTEGLLQGHLDGGAQVTMGSDCDARQSNVVTRPDARLTSWGGASFTLTLLSRKVLHVLSVSGTPSKVAAPTALYQDLGITCPVIPKPPAVAAPNACDTNQVERYRTTDTYLLNADAPTWREARSRDKRPFGVVKYQCSRPSQVTIVADDCRTNVDYKLTVTFTIDGDPTHVYTSTFPAFHLRARVNHATFLTSLEGLRYPFPFSGGPDGCAGHGVSTTRPYRSLPDGILTVLVHYVARTRASTPGMTMSQAVDAVIGSLEKGGTRRMPSGYGATDLLDVCHRAQADPARWRGTCGPP